MIGGSYRFSEQHIAEIIRIFERAPEEPSSAPAPRRITRIHPSAKSAGLQARTPRRKRATPRQAAR